MIKMNGEKEEESQELRICPIMSRPFPLGVQQSKSGLVGGEQQILTLQPLLCVRDKCALWVVLKGEGFCAFKRQALSIHFIEEFFDKERFAG